MAPPTQPGFKVTGPCKGLAGEQGCPTKISTPGQGQAGRKSELFLAYIWYSGHSRLLTWLSTGPVLEEKVVQSHVGMLHTCSHSLKHYLQGVGPQVMQAGPGNP